MIQLEKRRRYWSIPHHRYVYFVREFNYYWAGKTYHRFIFEDLCGAVCDIDCDANSIDKYITDPDNKRSCK